MMDRKKGLTIPTGCPIDLLKENCPLPRQGNEKGWQTVGKPHNGRKKKKGEKEIWVGGFVRMYNWQVPFFLLDFSELES